MRTVKQALKSYVFTDQTLCLPDPFTRMSLDILEELMKVKTQTGLDFYFGIRDALKLLHDGHTSFSPPCTLYFQFLLPYTFYVEPVDGLRCIKDSIPWIDSKYTLRLIPFDSYLEYLYIHSPGFSNLTGCTIVSLSIPGLPTIPGEESFDTLWRWTQQHISDYYTPSAKISDTLLGSFVARTPGLVPPEPITVTYRGSDNEQHITTIPFFLGVSNNISSWKDTCVAKFIKSRPIFRQANHRNLNDNLGFGIGGEGQRLLNIFIEQNQFAKRHYNAIPESLPFSADLYWGICFLLLSFFIPYYFRSRFTFCLHDCNFQPASRSSTHFADIVISCLILVSRIHQWCSAARTLLPPQLPCSPPNPRYVTSTRYRQLVNLYSALDHTY